MIERHIARYLSNADEYGNRHILYGFAPESETESQRKHREKMENTIILEYIEHRLRYFNSLKNIETYGDKNDNET